MSETLSNGVQGLWKKNKVTLIEGDGSLNADGNVIVGDETYEAKAVVLATGSVALPIPGVEFGGRVVDTWGAWSLPEQPKKIAVVGAGASGSEIASAYARFGTEVILIEMLDQILPAEDKDIAKIVERSFKKQGIEISTGSPVENVEVGESSVKFTYGDKSAEVDYLAIAGGRAPDTEGLGLEAAGVELDEGGRKIKVDEFGRTTNPKVFAIGDLVNKKALAHKAEEEGVVAVETAGGVETEPVDQELLVGATFTHPQVASVGLTEDQAKEAGHEVKVGKQKIAGEGAGTVYDDKEGLVKLVIDAKYGEVLGAHIVGNRACDMIAELVATMALEGGYQELAGSCIPTRPSPRPCSTPPAPSTAGRSTPERCKPAHLGVLGRSSGHARVRSPPRFPASPDLLGFRRSDSRAASTSTSGRRTRIWRGADLRALHRSRSSSSRSGGRSCSAGCSRSSTAAPGR